MTGIFEQTPQERAAAAYFKLHPMHDSYGSRSAYAAGYAAGRTITDAELLALLPGTPDGGDVPVLEQLQRMAEDARLMRDHVARLQTTRDELMRVLNTNPPGFLAKELIGRVSVVDKLLKELGR